jgi:hypothetical protein
MCGADDFPIDQVLGEDHASDHSLRGAAGEIGLHKIVLQGR